MSRIKLCVTHGLGGLKKSNMPVVSLNTSTHQFVNMFIFAAQKSGPRLDMNCDDNEKKKVGIKNVKVWSSDMETSTNRCSLLPCAVLVGLVCSPLPVVDLSWHRSSPTDRLFFFSLCRQFFMINLILWCLHVWFLSIYYLLPAIKAFKGTFVPW